MHDAVGDRRAARRRRGSACRRPRSAAPFEGSNGDEARPADGRCAPLAALVFKTHIDPHAGKVSYVRVLSGTLKQDTAGRRRSRRAPGPHRRAVAGHVEGAQAARRGGGGRHLRRREAQGGEDRRHAERREEAVRRRSCRRRRRRSTRGRSSSRARASRRRRRRRCSASARRIRGSSSSTTPQSREMLRRGARRAAPGHHARATAAARVDRLPPRTAAHPVPRDGARAREGRRGQAEEADRRPRAVRRLLHRHRADAARCRVRVRGRDRRRRRPAAVHPERREGRPQGDGARHARGLPARRLQGAPRRRQVPRGRLVGRGLPGRRRAARCGRRCSRRSRPARAHRDASR